MLNGTDILVKPNSVAILGFHDGSAGQIECWFEEVSGYHIACFVHESEGYIEVNVESENRKRVSQRIQYPEKNSFKGRPFIVAMDWIEQLKELGIRQVLPLTPDNRERLRQIEACRENDLELVSAIHPTTTILDGATIEPGVWINAGCIVGYQTEIQSGVVMNTGAQVDHHNILSRCCKLDPGVVTSGNVTLRECSRLHTGATVIPRVEIGADAIVGAGAVVIEDIPPRCTAVGVPAKVIKFH